MKQLADSIANGAGVLEEAERTALLQEIAQLKAILQTVEDNKLFTIDDAAAALGVKVRSRILERARTAARESLNIHDPHLTPKQSSKIYKWIIAHAAE